MQLVLLPGMDGTGKLFEPLLESLPATIPAVVVGYPTDKALDYEGLLPLVKATVPKGPFVVVGESFSGPLALMLASCRPPGLRGVVLCATFVRPPMSILKKLGCFVRPWMFRIQPLWLLSFVLLGRHGFGKLGRQLRSAVRSVSAYAFAERARAVAGVDVTAELKTCEAPILYLQAAGDMVVGRRCWELVRSVRSDAELKVLPGPHLVLQVSAREAAATLGEFCELVGAQKTTGQTEI